MGRVKESVIVFFLMLFLVFIAGKQDNKMQVDVVRAAQEEMQTVSVVLETDTEQEEKEAEEEPEEKEYLWYEDDYLLKTKPVQDDNKMLAVAGVYQYIEQEKGEFEPVLDYAGAYPEDLVIRLEKEVFGSLDYDLNMRTWEEMQQGSFFGMLRELGAETYEVELDEIYELFPELEGTEFESKYDAYDYVYGGGIDCSDMFHFQLAPGEDNYLFVLDGGGTSGIAELELTKRVGDEFVLISRFQTPNFGYGRVIECEGKFFYIYAQRNYNLKCYDGIRIYMLGENVREENLLIQYLPQNYVWEISYWGDWEAREFWTGLEDYVESIKTLLTTDDYMENGQVEGGGFYNFTGNEVCEYGGRDGIDFTNTGIPVYMERTSFVPSNGLKWHLNVKFYTSEKQTERTEELERLDIADGVGNYGLVQLWFKEIEGKVVTFRLYWVADYCYMLNVILQEGNEITTLRNYLLVPQKELILTEGNVYWY